MLWATHGTGRRAFPMSRQSGGGHIRCDPSGVQDMAVLSEQGMYFFLARSDKPTALPMQKWVAGEVLPSIRKTGSYGGAPASCPGSNCCRWPWRPSSSVLSCWPPTRSRPPRSRRCKISSRKA
ncbi:Bro-N domain-containing protein [Azotobacter sp. CWF10]